MPLRVIFQYKAIFCLLEFRVSLQIFRMTFGTQKRLNKTQIQYYWQRSLCIYLYCSQAHVKASNIFYLKFSVSARSYRKCDGLSDYRSTRTYRTDRTHTYNVGVPDLRQQCKRNLVKIVFHCVA